MRGAPSNRSDLRPVPTTADEWFARRHAPDRTRDEEAAFKAWLESDPSHESEYAECERFWRVPQGLSAQPDLAAEALHAAGLYRAAAGIARQADGPPESAPTRTAAKWAAATALAASLAAIVWLLAPIELRDPGAIKTARGEQRTVALSDGSTVQINTDSLFVARMNERERRVELLRGEAFFNVVRDPARPFVVKAGASEVRVVGTQFSVREHGGKLEVIVKEGTVNVIPDISRVTAADAGLTAWRTGSLEFDGMTLDDVVTEVNRYTDTRLVIGHDSLKSQRISGRVRVGDIDTIRFILRERFDIDSVERDGIIRLSRQEGTSAPPAIVGR